MPSWLFIVAREAPDLHEHLQREFAQEPEVQVVLDRRLGERRRRDDGPAGRERRRADRRQHTVAEELRTVGYAFVRTDRRAD